MAQEILKLHHVDTTTDAVIYSTYAPRHNLTATADPGTGNDETQYYFPSSMWKNTSGNKLFVCKSNATGAAVWEEIGGGGGGASASAIGDLDAIAGPSLVGNPSVSSTAPSLISAVNGAGAGLCIFTDEDDELRIYQSTDVGVVKTNGEKFFYQLVNTADLGGDITAAGKALLDDADAAAQRTTLGLGTMATQASSAYQAVSEKGNANGYASLDSSGQIPAGQIPAVAITEYLGSVASQSAMLALSGQKGDWCTRSDSGTNWVITGTDPTILAGWTELTYPGSAVSSVAGRTGSVTLAIADITDTTTTGRALATAANAGAARSTLGLGTAATSNTGDFAPASHTHTASQISDSTTTGRALVTATDAAAGRTALGLGTMATQSKPFSYVKLHDTKTANTDGGSYTGGTQITRTLNTEVHDDDGVCSLSSNRFTLNAGTYIIRATVPGARIVRHQALLVNITDSTTTIHGTSEYAGSGSTDSQTCSIIAGQFTIATSKAFEIQHIGQTSATTIGLGIAANLGSPEIYTVVELWKIA